MILLRLVLWLLARLLTAMVGLWLITVLAIYGYGLRDESRPADAIVVLGAAQYDGRPSPVLRARLDHAIDLYERGTAPTVIFTGGVGLGDTVSEAEVGRRYAIQAGLPETATLTEAGGLRSVHSLSAVSGLMRERDLESAVLVSDSFHMLRLRIIAYRLNLRAYSSPTRSSPIANDAAREWRHVLRESFVMPLAFVRPASADADRQPP